MFIKSLLELYLEHYFYLLFMKDDKAYRDFLDATGGQPDLSIQEHGEALLYWLRKWGCRQFATAYTDSSLAEIRSWHEQFSKKLPSFDMQLLSINDEKMMNDIATAYDDLCKRIASQQTRNNEDIGIRIGHTGASKILFALRPNSLPPWDGPIRKATLKVIQNQEGNGRLTENGQSYAQFMCYLQDILRDFTTKCIQHGIALQDVPEKFGCDRQTSLLKILDEHLWVTQSLSGGGERQEGGPSLQEYIQTWFDA